MNGLRQYIPKYLSDDQINIPIRVPKTTLKEELIDLNQIYLIVTNKFNLM